MNTHSNPRVGRYLKKLKAALRHLSEADRGDIVREIEGHILEKWEADSGGAFDEGSLAGVLGKLGTPEVIAAQYCEQRGWASAPPRHTLRNTLIAIAAVLFVGIFGVSYFAIRYVVSPVIGFLKSDESVVEVSDNGVRLFGGKIAVSDEGVNIRGVLKVDADSAELGELEGIISDAGELKIDFDSFTKEAAIAEEKGNFKTPAEGVDHLTLDAKNARVTLKGGNPKEITVEYLKKAYGKDAKVAKGALQQVSLSHRVEGSAIVIESVYPRERPKGVDALGIDITMSVPKQMSATVDVKNFKLDVDGLGGSFTLDAKNGAADISNVGGTTVVSMKNGRIDVKKIGGSASVEMKNGAVKIDDIAGNLNVEMVNGPLDIEGVTGNLEAETSRGPVSVSGVKGDIEIESKMGPVNVRFVPGYDFTFEGESNLGSLVCDFPVERDGTEARGKVGKGTHHVEIESRMGAVTVSRSQ